MTIGGNHVETATTHIEAARNRLSSSLAMEFAVVVVGVLLALFLAQWAQDRREARQMALAEEAIREELRMNLATVQMRSEARGLLRNLETTRDVRSRMDMATQTLRDLQIGPSPTMDAVIDGWPNLNTNGNPAILLPCFVAPENPLRLRNK